MDATYSELQSRLREIWPAVSLRSIGDVERTVVVIHSLGVDIPDHMAPVFPAYEERFLCLMLSLLRAPRSRVIYATSSPIHPPVLDYYFSLVPELDTPEARSRFLVVSLVDSSNVPLSRKLLARPGAIRRIRDLIGDPEIAIMFPYCVTEDELELAVALGIPVYGSDPALGWLGTKRGGRRVFEEEGVRHPIGVEVDGQADVPGALRELQRRAPEARTAVLKLNEAVSGLGNALVDLAVAETDLTAGIELEDRKSNLADYLTQLDNGGGIVEQRIEGDSFRSPSVQLQISPAGQVEIISTHDQVLGGPHGQTYLGCTFPADPGYAEQIAVAGLKIGRRLAKEGAIGRCAVDFVSELDDGEWRSYAIEINLRCGGTTHPHIALTTLTDGRYDSLAGEYRSHEGRIKHYVASDYLSSPGYESLTPDDLIDIVAERGFGWDREHEVGIVLHMLSALAVAGRVGLTAIGDSGEDAQARFDEVKRALDEAASPTVVLV